MPTEIDVVLYPEILESRTSDDGQVFMLHVKDAAAKESVIGFRHREIPHLIEVAAIQEQVGAKLRGDQDVTVFNARSFSVGVSEDGHVILSLAIGAAAKLSFALPGAMPAQLSETLALAGMKTGESKPGGAVN